MPGSALPKNPAMCYDGAMFPLQALGDRFAFNEGFLDQLTEGFAAADWLARQGEANHAQWLLGHLASTRSWAARELSSKRPVRARRTPARRKAHHDRTGRRHRTQRPQPCRSSNRHIQLFLYRSYRACYVAAPCRYESAAAQRQLGP